MFTKDAVFSKSGCSVRAENSSFNLMEHNMSNARFHLERTKYLLVSLVLSLAVFGLGRPAVAQDMDKRIENKVKRASVMVWMGVGKAGEEKMDRQGSGSGSFINRTGIVVTNNHVVDPGHGRPARQKHAARWALNPLKHTVVVNGGTDSEHEYDAKVLYQSESADLALLQVYDEDGEPLMSPEILELFPSTRVEKDDSVWCFGFPGGAKGSRRKGKSAAVTVTSGNITEVPRTPGGRIPYLGTDVIAQPGNSGGPLVNYEGHIFGIMSRLGDYQKGADGGGSGLYFNIVPADLVADMMKVGLRRGKIPSDTDLEPFLRLLADKDGKIHFPGMERHASRITVRLENGDEVFGTLSDPNLIWKTVLGDIEVPAEQAAYAVGQDGKATLLLDGGDRLSGDASEIDISFVSSLGTRTKLNMADVKKVAFKKPSNGELSPPDVEALLLEADGCRLSLTDVKGQLEFKSESGAVSRLTLEALKTIRTKSYKQVITMADGSTLTGRFSPAPITATLAWTGTTISLSFDKLKGATFIPVNPAKNDRGVQRTLAQTIGIDERYSQDLAKIASLIGSGQIAQAGALLDEKLTRSAMKGMTTAAKEQVKTLRGEYLLRNGDYEEAKAAFKKLRNAKQEEIEWHAKSRFELLDAHRDSMFRGSALRDPAVFREAAFEMANDVVLKVRRDLRNYDKAKPDKHTLWKSTVRKMGKIEDELRVANSLNPGQAENDIFRVWGFILTLNDHEFKRLEDEQKELRRSLEDFRGGRGRQVQQRAASLRAKIAKLEKHLKDVQRSEEDMRAMMGVTEVGFRLDDPEAAEILN